MSEKKPKRTKRSLRNLIIEPFKQMSFGLYMLGISTAFMIISAWLFIRSFIKQYQHVMELFQVVEPEARWEFIINDVFYSNALLLGSLYLLFAFVLITTVFKLTHRYYGPLVSIREFLKQLELGNYSCRISIRKKDHLQKLVAQLNHLAASLEKKHPQPDSKENTDSVEDSK